MLRIGICDDSDISLQNMLSLCHEYFQNNIGKIEYQMFESGEEVIEYCDNDDADKMDILFLDIEMSGISGIELMNRVLKLDKIWRIAFVSSHNEQMKYSFGIKTIGFIEKPAAYCDVSDILEKILLEKQENISVLITLTNGKTKKLYVEDIRYIEAEGRYTYIYTDEKIFCTSKISELEKELNDSSVVRVHKSYMVNIEYMSLKNGRILMQDWKVELPIGRSYKENVKRAYHEYGIKMARRRI